MTKANQYNLKFQVIDFEGRKEVIINTTISNTSIISQSLISFIQPCDIEFTQELINEINELDYSVIGNSSFSAEFWDYDYKVKVKIFDSPKRAAFWDISTYSYIDMPLQDFVDILQEWVNFLNSLPFEYFVY